MSVVVVIVDRNHETTIEINMKKQAMALIVLGSYSAPARRWPARRDHGHGVSTTTETCNTLIAAPVFKILGAYHIIIIVIVVIIISCVRVLWCCYLCDPFDAMLMLMLMSHAYFHG